MKKSFESRWRKSRQDKHVDSTLCKSNWKRNQHKNLTSNLETVFNSILWLRLKTALTNEAEILQNFIID